MYPRDRRTSVDRTMTKIGDRPILIAYDGSDHARAAIERASALLKPCAAVVVCVWARVELAAPAATIAVPRGVALKGARGLDATECRRAEGVASEGAELARRGGFAAEARAVCGDGPTWRAIVDCATELDAAAVVAGTRARSRATAALLGSTAEGILHYAHRPVLVVALD
jgi:nucleotide-binding universal stress UspA family protein